FLLLANERPQLITLHVSDFYVTDLLRHDALAFLASNNKQCENRGVMDFRDALHARNAVPFEQEPKDHFDFLDGHIHTIQMIFAGFRENLTACRTLEALAVLTFPEFSTIDPAGMAGHCEISH